jgi:hypothetical protein
VNPSPAFERWKRRRGKLGGNSDGGKLGTDGTFPISCPRQGDRQEEETLEPGFRKDRKTMKRINIPGFTAEASFGSVGIFRARRANKGTLAADTVSPAIETGGGPGGFLCSQDDPNCVDCTDDIDNTICAECKAGGSLQCCQDPSFCVANPRPTVDCTVPWKASVCFECGLGGHLPCCLTPPCNVIPPRTLPPTCFRFGGRMICNFGAGLGGIFAR